jgi:hypothetical protein
MSGALLLGRRTALGSPGVLLAPGLHNSSRPKRCGS